MQALVSTTWMGSCARDHRELHPAYQSQVLLQPRINIIQFGTLTYTSWVGSLTRGNIPFSDVYPRISRLAFRHGLSRAAWEKGGGDSAGNDEEWPYTYLYYADENSPQSKLSVTPSLGVWSMTLARAMFSRIFRSEFRHQIRLMRMILGGHE